MDDTHHLQQLPSEIVSLIGEHIDTNTDIRSCMLSSKMFSSIMFNRRKSRTIVCSHARPLKAERIASVQKLQPNIDTYVFNIQATDMTTDEIQTMSTIIDTVCALDNVKTVQLFFSQCIHFLEFFENNLHTDKCIVTLYCLPDNRTASPIPFPSHDIKKFAGIYMCTDFKCYDACKHIMPYCNEVLVSRMISSNDHILRQSDSISFEHVDAKKTKVYIYTSNMNLRIYGGDCVRYFMCYDMIVYGAAETTIIEHYKQHPLCNLDECVLGSNDVFMSSRLDSYYFYKLLPSIKSKRYILPCVNHPFMLPYIRHLHTALDISYDNISVICTSLRHHVIGRLLQLLVHQGIKLVTSEKQMQPPWESFVTLKFETWENHQVPESEKNDILTTTDILHLMNKVDDEYFQFAWFPVMSTCEYIKKHT